ncbi:hypothetical protein BJY00DRAFT_318644 [Aspergillus carlsbadensis]|nr:hypothetical protein BJY00DRAFT_318644 [Aspergillus carlsbadensis]
MARETVTKSELVVIPLIWARTFPLFYAQSSCPGASFHANLGVDLEANLVMDATYAYYLSGTFIPPSKPEAFAYFGMSPTARKTIIDTLAYPGLAVKGIAAVRPTLDVYGEIRGVITLHGEVNTGAQVSVGKAEVYWPQNKDAKDEYKELLGLKSGTQSPGPFSVKPVFKASVAVNAQLDIEITPEASIGIKIGGGKLVGGTTIMDAQLHGYFIGDLSFQAHGDYSTSTNQIQYSFGAYFK